MSFAKLIYFLIFNTTQHIKRIKTSNAIRYQNCLHHFSIVLISLAFQVFATAWIGDYIRSSFDLMDMKHIEARMWIKCMRLSWYGSALDYGESIFGETA